MKLTDNTVPKDIRIIIKGKQEIGVNKLSTTIEYSKKEIGAINWPKAVKSMLREKLDIGAVDSIQSVEIRLCR